MDIVKMWERVSIGVGRCSWTKYRLGQSSWTKYKRGVVFMDIV